MRSIDSGPRGTTGIRWHYKRQITYQNVRSVRASASSTVSSKTLTEQIFEKVDRLNEGQAGGAGGRTRYQAFQAVDKAWFDLRNKKEGAAAGPAPQFVTTSSSALGTPLDYDLVVCGGTLGIFAAVALAQRGLKVAVVERGELRGRSQEWNISRKEMEELVALGLLSSAELEGVVAMEFNPVRVGFHQGHEVWTRDVLNLGVSPAKLVELMRGKLLAAGGALLESTGVEGVQVHPDGVALRLAQQASSRVTAQLVVDCMGHASPVVRQVRWGRKPDGVCLVVGTLGSGFDNNSTADVIYTTTDLQPLEGPGTTRLQYFWEAFPAGSGPSDRTTYMFTYMDAQPWRPSLAQLFDDYWRLMPQYQGVDLDAITFQRVLFGFFPTYRQSPLQPAFDRVLQIGDASGIQSPLSFGGFGALTRHLGRLTSAISEALEAGATDRESLALIHAYNPGLSSAWMLQRAMSVRQQQSPSPNMINRMLSGNFKAMQGLGDHVMKPFLQDVIQFGPLLQTMAQQVVLEPLFVPALLQHVGVEAMLDWLQHVAALGAYSSLHSGVAGQLQQLRPQLQPLQRYRLNRLLDAWQYGSGADYKL